MRSIAASVLVTIAATAPGLAFGMDTRLHCEDTASNVYMHVTIDPNSNSYFNGEMTVYGSKLIQYFKSHGYLTGESVHCGYYITEQCSMRARVSSDFSVYAGAGRFESNYVVFPDAGGMKIQAYVGNNRPNDTKIDWWFSRCYTSR